MDCRSSLRFIVATLFALASPGLAFANYVPGDCTGAPNPDAAPLRILYVDPASTNWDCNVVSTTNPVPTVRLPSVGDALRCADRPGDAIHIQGNSSASSPRVYPKIAIDWEQGGTLAQPLVIRPAPGTYVRLDPAGNITDYGGIVSVTNSKNIVIRGFEITNSSNTVPPPANQTIAEIGVFIHASSAIAIHGNNIHNIGRQAVAMDGNNLLIQSNTINKVATFKWNKTNKTAWDGGLSASRQNPTSCATWKQNTIGEVYGEGLDVLRVNNALVTGNAVYDAWAVNIYLDGSTKVTVDGNYSFSTSAAPQQWDASLNKYVNAAGIVIAREAEVSGDTPSFQPGEILISNNIVDGTGQGIRYGNYGHASSSFWNLRIMHNDLINTHVNAIKIDQPKIAPGGGNRVLNNIIKRASDGVGVDLYIDPTWVSGYWITAHNLFVTSPAPWPGDDGTNNRQDPVLRPTLGVSCTYHLILAQNPGVARNMGTGTTSVPRDYWGVLRSTTTPSIGVDEWPSSLTQNPCGP